MHEVPDTIADTKIPDPVYIEVNASQLGVEKSRQRWLRDAELLLKSHAATPDNPRDVFYLAQTYHCLGERDKAYHYYQVREKLPGWDEENFITLFRLGCLAEEMQMPWSTAMDHYLKAYALRPWRIEPLVKIADHYWYGNNIPTCYLFIRQAYNLPYPSQDILFLEEEMYVYTRYEIMSRCAWYMNEFALGEAATKLALNIYPDMPHLHSNLALYKQKLKELII